jgi:NAD(P)-dependent dehydrogenase (short-subunit alcohol dehydrogenase family)
MNDRHAVVVGPATAFTAGLGAALRSSGWDVALGEVTGPVELAVFVPDFGPPASLLESDPVRWFRTIDSSLTHAFRFAKRCVPLLKPQRGALVFVSSIFGEIGAPDRSATCAAAAGIVGFAKALTLEEPAIRIGVVASPIPLPDEPWGAADVELEAMRTLDEASITFATVDAVLLLANDLEGHHRGSVIRVPSGITT